MHLRLAAVAVVVTCCAFSTARAQEPGEDFCDDCARQDVPGRYLGNFAFVPVTDVRGPFATTDVGTITALGSTDIDFQLRIEALEERLEDDLPFTGVLQRFDGQVTVFDRFAVRADAFGQAFFPDEASSALNVAVDASYGAGAGLLGQVIRKDRFILALTADYHWRRDSLASPVRAIQTSIEARAIRAGSLFTEVDTHAWSAGASLALGFTDWLGLVGEGRFLDEDTEALDENRQFIDVAGALGVNFGPGIPVGATAFWLSRIPLGDGNDLEHDWRYGGGAFYTDVPNIDLGVEVFWRNIQREPGVDIRSTDRIFVGPKVRAYF